MSNYLLLEWGGGGGANTLRIINPDIPYSVALDGITWNPYLTVEEICVCRFLLKCKTRTTN